MASLFNFFGGFSRGERKNPRKTSRKSPRKSRALRMLEPLEDRRMMTTTLFLDFGEGFGSGGLTMTAGQLRDTLTGPDIIDDGSPKMTASTPLRFDSLADVVSSQQIDFDGTGGNGDNADFQALKSSIVTIVERQFAPFDVSVEIGRASSLADVTNAMNRNSTATNGKADAYVFVTGVVRTDRGTLVGEQIEAFGKASGLDLDDRKNSRDETVVVFADNFDGTLVNGVAIPIDIALANVASHEAGHSFGLAHSHATSSALQQLYTDSDLMVDGGGSQLDLTNVGTFSRFDLMEGDDNTDPFVEVNAWSHLVNDADIGARAGVDYVTGTGALDRITITDLNNGQARVDVEVYDNATAMSLTPPPGAIYMSQFISYNVSTTGTIIVDAGFRDDEIILVGNLSSLVTVFGGGGADSLEVRNTGSALNSVVANENRIFVNGREARSSEMEALRITGNGRTILNIDGTAATTGQSILLGADYVAGITAAPLTYSGLSSLTITAGNYGNQIWIFDTPDMHVNLYSGTGADTTLVTDTTSSLTIHGQSGADSVQLGLPDITASIGGQLAINNAGSYTKLIVDDTARASYRSVSLQVVNGIAKLGGFGAYVTMVTNDLSGIDFTGGNSNYQFLVYDTPSRIFSGKERITTSIVTGSGSEYINVLKSTGTLTVDAGSGANKMVANIDKVRGATVLTGSGGQNTYHFHDASITTPGLVYTLSAGALSRTDSSGNNKTGSITFGSPYRLQVNGGSGGNTYLVKEAPRTSGGRVSLFTGDGNDRVTVERASSTLEIDLQGGSDALTFVAAGNSPNYSATVIGGAGNDSVVYDDRLVKTPQQYLVTPTSLGRAASPINVQTIESIEVTGGSSNDTFGYAGTIPGGIVQFHGGAGSDTLDLSRFAKNVVIDLVSQRATDVTLMSTFENAIGGAGNDQLLGTGGANLLDGRGGRDLIFGGLGVDALTGGEGDDLLLAGSTPHAASVAARDAIMAEWTRTDASYADRVTHLLTGGGLNGSTLLNRQTYTADPSANTLRGNAGLDLFFGSLARDTHDRSLAEGETFIDPDATQFSVQVNATAVTATYFYLDSKSFDHKAAFNTDLTTGTHSVNIGGYGFNFNVTADGRIEYAAALEGLLSGRGTSSLRINGAKVVIDATAITSDYFVLDYMTQDKSKPLTVRLMPGYHHLQSPVVMDFSVTESGKIAYDASQEGILLGQGTNQLLVRGAAVTIDARALWSPYLALDYLPVDPRQVLNARLLPGLHHIQTYGGDVLLFRVAANGQVSYDASLEGIFTGNGTTTLSVPGLQVTIDPTLSTADYFTMNYATSSARTPTPFALTPGSHFIIQAGVVHWFTVSTTGLVDYDPSLDTSFSGRGTRTLKLLV